MFAASKTNTPSVSAPDPQFNYVTMLLHGDGTNGAQNNTFVDSSSNNFTITRNGNTTQGSFSPYGSNWSTYLDGTGYLTTGNTSAFQFGTGDFTVEFWAFFIDQGTSNYNAVTSMGSNSLNIQNQFGNFNVQFEGISNVITFSLSPYYNNWHHFAVVRQSGTTQVYIDGTSVAYASDTRDYQGSSALNIGLRSGGGYLNSYLSNFRACKTAVYTSTFTPSTAPLTTTSQGASNCTILTCQSNRFIDNSASALVFTVGAGTPSVQRFNPFGASTAYSTSVIGGSGYYEQSVDTINGIAVNNSTCMAFSGDFTIEGWFYQTSTSQKVVCGQLSASNFQIQFNKSNVAGRTGIYNNSVWTTLDCSSSPVNQWFHLAYSRSGSSVYIYLNGISQGSISVSGTLSFSGTNGGGIGALAGYWNGGWVGYISSFQASNIAKYTGSNFTPPTAPPTAISSTNVLVNFTNGAIYDNAMMNDLETAGNAQISTSVKKYGTGSLAFNGTSNCCLTTQSVMSSSGPFTFECWAYWNDTGTSGNMGMLCSQYSSGASGRMLFGSQSGALVLRVDGGTVYLTTSVSTGTWYFVAWTFDGTTHRLFLNGTLASSSTSVPALYTGVNTSIGGQPNSLLADYCLNGYIDDVRITKGVARYTTTFTPPTAAFPNTGPL